MSLALPRASGNSTGWLQPRGRGEVALPCEAAQSSAGQGARPGAHPCPRPHPCPHPHPHPLSPSGCTPQHLLPGPLCTTVTAGIPHNFPSQRSSSSPAVATSVLLRMRQNPTAVVEPGTAPGAEEFASPLSLLWPSPMPAWLQRPPQQQVAPLGHERSRAVPTHCQLWGGDTSPATSGHFPSPCCLRPPRR